MIFQGRIGLRASRQRSNTEKLMRRLRRAAGRVRVARRQLDEAVTLRVSAETLLNAHGVGNRKETIESLATLVNLTADATLPYHARLRNYNRIEVASKEDVDIALVLAENEGEFDEDSILDRVRVSRNLGDELRREVKDYCRARGVGELSSDGSSAGSN